MPLALTEILIWIAATGAGVMAGVYFAFSGFIMKSLDQLDSDKSVAAMNAINEVILRSWFMPVFFGSSLLYLLLAVMALLDWENANAPLLLIASLSYIVGMFLCTVVFNVPLNNLLAKNSENNADKTSLWSHYFENWTRWNHLRTASSLFTCVVSIYILSSS